MPQGRALPRRLRLDATRDDRVAPRAGRARVAQPRQGRARLPGLRDLAARLPGAGRGRSTCMANAAGGEHLLRRFGPAAADGAGAGARPFRHRLADRHARHDAVPRRGGRAYGPGTFDMKASLVLIEAALAAIRASAARCPGRCRPVHLGRGDRQPGSRDLIEDEAKKCCTARGRAAAGRRAAQDLAEGGGPVDLTRGRPAHAGVEPEKGVSAVVELAHQILAIEGLQRPGAGRRSTSASSRAARPRTSSPLSARPDRRPDRDPMAEARGSKRPCGLRRRSAPAPAADRRPEFKRPPMERSPGVVALFERARASA